MGQEYKYAMRKHSGVQLKRQVICKNVYMLPSQKIWRKMAIWKKNNDGVIALI